MVTNPREIKRTSLKIICPMPSLPMETPLYELCDFINDPSKFNVDVDATLDKISMFQT